MHSYLESIVLAIGVRMKCHGQRTGDAALDGEGHGDPERPGLQRERDGVDVRHEREVAAVVRDRWHQLPQRQRQERAHEEQRVRAGQRREVHVRRVRPH